MKQAIQIGLLVFLVLSPLSADSGEIRIDDIRIEGIKKTRPSTVLKIIGVEQGSFIKRESLETIEQKLRKSGLFADISLLLLSKDKSAVLSIELEERGSFIPVPFAAYTGERTLIGMSVIEANFLGLNRQLISSAFYDLDGYYSLTCGYIDPDIASSSTLLALFVSGGAYLREDRDPADTSFRSFSGKELSLNSSLRFRTGQRLQPGLRVGYDLDRVDEGLVESGQILSAGVSLRWSDLYYLRFFEKGIQISGEYESSVELEHKHALYHTFQAGLMYNHELFRKQLVRFRIKGGINTLPTAFLDGLTGPGFRPLPSGDCVEREYLAGSLEWEVPVLPLSWGTGATSLFFDGGLLDPDDGSAHRWFYGPGLGFRLYIDKLVLPALQLNAAWNIVEQSFHFSFSLGMSR